MINYNFEKRRLKNISNVLLLNKKIDPKKILIDVKRISFNEDVDADLKNAEQQFKLILDECLRVVEFSALVGHRSYNF